MSPEGVWQVMALCLVAGFVLGWWTRGGEKK
jgi:hypothetical protein